MERFFLLYLITSSVCISTIEFLKIQWPAPEPEPTPSISLIAIPPKPEGALDQEASAEGSAVHYTEEKCNNTRLEYRNLCFHQLARQHATSDLIGAQESCNKITETDMKWECMSDIAEQYAPFDRDESLTLCPSIEKKKWRDQCVFGIALALSTIDSPWAFRTCDQAGKWRDFCRHDVNGEIAVVDVDLALKHCTAEEGDLLRRKTCWHGIGKYIARVDVDRAFAACARVPRGPDNLYRENCHHGLGWGASEKAGKEFAQTCTRSGEQQDSCTLGVAYNLRRFAPEEGMRLCQTVQRTDLKTQCETFLSRGSIH
jgi:hypothetical protein